MRSKDIEEEIKKYPNKIKQDNNAIAALTKGVTALAKAQQGMS